MKLEISKSLLDMSHENTRQDIIDNRDRVIKELKIDYQKYKDIIDKVLKIRIKYEGPLTQSQEDFNIYKCELNFEPISFSLGLSSDSFIKVLNCNLVIYNLSIINNGEEISLKKYLKDNPKHSFPQIMISNMGGYYIIKEQFKPYSRYFGLSDYYLEIKNLKDIIFRFDE